jgi:hypothetical protein
MRAFVSFGLKENNPNFFPKGDFKMATLAFDSTPVARTEPAAAKPKFGWFVNFLEAVRVARIMQNSPARDHTALINEWRANMMGTKN